MALLDGASAKSLNNLSARVEAAGEIHSATMLTGNSAAIRAVNEYLAKIAATDCNVLVTGETGTGKELAAAAIHEGSARRRDPLICVNCAAIPDGLLESEMFGHERGAFTGAVVTRKGRFQEAHGGTIFLDEVGDLSPLAQAKLLRVLENRNVTRLGGSLPTPVDVRVIAATNQSLHAMVEGNSFRPDLYYRLAVAQVVLPPLRDRTEDIPALAARLIERINAAWKLRLEGVSHEALAGMARYRWPGNVRELRNVLEAASVQKQCGMIERSDLPYWFQPDAYLADGGPLDERQRVVYALDSAGWNKSQAAHRLKCSRMTLYRKMARYQIEGGAARHPRVS